VISTRGSALKSARSEGFRWAGQVCSEAFGECIREGYDRQRHAKIIAGMDRPFDVGPDTGAPSVPARWRSVYWREVERVFRREVRYRADEIMWPRNEE